MDQQKYARVAGFCRGKVWSVTLQSFEITNSISSIDGENGVLRVGVLFLFFFLFQLAAQKAAFY